MEAEKKSNIKQNKFFSGWFIAGIVVIFGALVTPFLIILLTDTSFTVSNIDDLGPVGDFFGGTTVGLLSLASIFFVIHTITIQRDELKLTQEELQLTREELNSGNTTAKVQQIDNAFYNMLSLHHQIVNNINIHQASKTFTGREAIERLNSILKETFAFRMYTAENPEKGYASWHNSSNTRLEYMEKVFGTPNSINQTKLDEVYKGFHDEFGNDIGHYMRHNYRIVKYIVNNVADDVNEQNAIKAKTGREPIIGDKRYYFGILRAQWSNAEFELILVNSLYADNNKFKGLILQYDVLDMKDLGEQGKMGNFIAYKNLIENFRLDSCSNIFTCCCLTSFTPSCLLFLS